MRVHSHKQIELISRVFFAYHYTILLLLLTTTSIVLNNKYNEDQKLITNCKKISKRFISFLSLSLALSLFILFALFSFTLFEERRRKKYKEEFLVVAFFSYCVFVFFFLKARGLRNK